jgi:hypothetical protein
MSWAEQLSPRALARIGGVLDLLNIVLGAFAIGFARSLPETSRC